MLCIWFLENVTKRLNPLCTVYHMHKCFLSDQIFLDKMKIYEVGQILDFQICDI